MPAVLSRGAAVAGRLRRAAPGLSVAGLARAPRRLVAPRWLHPCGACGSAAAGLRGRVTLAERDRPTWRQRQQLEDSNLSIWWLTAGLVTVFGGCFAFVPLYKMYCQSTGQGQAVKSHREYAPPPESDSEASKRLVAVDFTGTVHTALPWEFVPQQRRVVVGLGETALAFYRAKNTSDKPIIGVSVYHMIPPEAGLYFNKIQCFCFDEQLINPGEEVDLPIFFFVDPMMGKDSRFDHVDRITLSYLFFESDSELPEGYEDFRRSVPGTQTPLALAAPGPAEGPAPSAPAPAAG